MYVTEVIHMYVTGEVTESNPSRIKSDKDISDKERQTSFLRVKEPY